LSRRGIKKLLLFNNGTLYDKMPSHVFLCEELTRFSLFGLNLSVHPNFCGLKSLLVLNLLNNTYEFGALETLISGCPLLKRLGIEILQESD
jgi:hypothetical protein